MYTALAIMLAGFIAGRIFPGIISQRVLRGAVMGAIFLLLFLLGASIGSNSELLARLPTIGVHSLILTLFCMGGSILCAWLLTRGPHKKN